MENFLQPTLENENILIQPLQSSDFDRLHKVASDPKIWEQHPNPDRYKHNVFKTFFEGAITSGGAFIIIEKKPAMWLEVHDSITMMKMKIQFL